jgi:methylmalonyl-CoA mutase
LNGCFFRGSSSLLLPTEPGKNNFRTYGVILDEDTPVKEISNACLQGVRVIDTLLEQGYAIDKIVRNITFLVPLTTRLFTDVAKLRALRILWFQVVSSYGASSTPNDLFLHGYSLPWIKESYQPHGNMLKSTIAAIAGISGHCNALTIVPEDSSSRMMSRIARNTSTILLEESHLGKVNDPFAGAYALEVMTDRIAQDSWTLFQQLV